MFLGAYAGYWGAGVCTACAALPVLMDLFWYAPESTAGTDLASRLGQSLASHSGGDAALLIWDVVCLAGAITCDAVLCLMR